VSFREVVRLCSVAAPNIEAEKNVRPGDHPINMFNPRAFLAGCALALQLGISQVDAAFPVLGLKPVCLQQFYSPTTITSAGDGSGRLFICDQPGKIYGFHGGMLLPTPFLDLTASGNNKAIGQTQGYL